MKNSRCRSGIRNRRRLFKKMANKNYNVDLAILPDKKLMYDFAKEMYFDKKKL